MESEHTRVMSFKVTDPDVARKIEAAARLGGVSMSAVMRAGAVREAERRIARALEAEPKPAERAG